MVSSAGIGPGLSEGIDGAEQAEETCGLAIVDVWDRVEADTLSSIVEVCASWVVVGSVAGLDGTIETVGSVSPRDVFGGGIAGLWPMESFALG